jgi:hypothetical protein
LIEVAVDQDEKLHAEPLCCSPQGIAFSFPPCDFNWLMEILTGNLRMGGKINFA